MAQDKDITKQEDKFISFWAKVIIWAKAHEKKFYTGLTIVVVIGLGIWGYTQYNKSIEESAWNTYQETLLKFQDKPDSAELSQALTEFIETESGTKATLQARLNLAAIKVEQDDWAGAADAYRIFYEALPRGDAMRPLTAGAIGQCLEAKGDYDAALTWFAKMERVSILKPAALWGKGQTLEAAGRKDQAKSIYQDLVANHADSAYASIAADRLAALN